MNNACFSLSITHGPAMRNRPPSPIRIPSTWKETVRQKSSTAEIAENAEKT